ncbi:MAG: M15 family metallopeptidase [Candidatus Sumerlaeaceae bacterium]|nr:M15 family metallopeptidase [Candidatus Sumerlaeaceae bacterium]
MKWLLTTFLCSSLLLSLLVMRDSETNRFADGRLSCPPLPPAMARSVPPLEPPPRVDLALIPQLQSPARPAEAKIQLSEPEPNNQRLAEVKLADRMDWGIPNVPQPGPIVVASVSQPKSIGPSAVPPTVPQPPGPAEMSVVTEPLTTVTAVEQPTSAVIASKAPSMEPNLYLPEGALSEEGALLTLIKPELSAHEEPADSATASPFVIREGERVRPLTRLRNESDFDWIKFERDGRSWWAKAEYFIRVDPANLETRKTGNLPVGEEEVDRDSALPPDYHPTDLVALPREVLMDRDNREIKVRQEVATALNQMVKAAEKEGHRLRIFSGFRDFNYQKKLYLEAIEKNGPKQNGVAEPGYSEHQLGTTVDISNGDLKYVLSEAFRSTAEGRWLQTNAEKFGFRFSYTRENMGESGYKPEPWHLRYVGRVLPEGGKTRVAQR